MIIIAVRDKIDWKHMGEKKFLKQQGTRPSKVALKFFDQIIKPWNDHFTTSFFEYRHQLNKIAKNTWKAAKVPIVYGQRALREFVINLNGKDLIYPTDDDDWVSPKIGALISDTPVFSWKQGRLNVNGEMFRDERKYFRADNGNCRTNNTAFTVKTFQQHLASMPYIYHLDVGRQLKGLPSVRSCDILSTTIKHIGSLGYFQKTYYLTINDIAVIIKRITQKFQIIRKSFLSQMPEMEKPISQLEELYNSIV